MPKPELPGTFTYQMKQLNISHNGYSGATIIMKDEEWLIKRI
jgi:hypothetical protein